MRKNNLSPDIKRLVACLPLFCLQIGLSALEFSFQPALTKAGIGVSAAITLPEEVDLLGNVEEGYQAEIRYQFRLYRRGSLAFFRDQLISTANFTFTASKHFFFDEYVIESDDGKKWYFTDTAPFLDHFIHLRDYFLFSLPESGGTQGMSGYYLKGRVTLVPVKLEAPLHIIALFSTISKTSEWVSRNIEGGDTL